ncbi:hypothetical protein PPSIR1_28646 [Plesiocystis pacifica SIR-1]|uniref:Uncharacterized protein n=1 Tax=Plesiocystis pacifica SIR-1 TaxID=391625 RepID=A6GHS5_9BACT|nr:hypothetical protein [Plesiocystis pacifica]EDM74571.1 hypothetical protein PPSIR1_28646 [Plesiocystis pacifica SIR-1]
MPSFLHQGILSLLATHDTLLVELARHFEPRAARSLASGELARGSSELPNPAFPESVLHADLLVALPETLALAVEVQTSEDPLKRYSWLSYAAGARRRFECPGWTLVCIPDPDLRHKYRQMFEDEPRASPWFIEPCMLEPITTVERAVQDVSRATLTTLFHVRGSSGPACARGTLEALRRVDHPDRAVYRELVLTSMTEEQRAALPADIFEVDPDAPLGNLERTGFYFTTGHREGKNEGQRTELQRMILRTLELRGLTVDEASRARIEGCEEVETLRSYFERAVVVEGLDALFQP